MPPSILTAAWGWAWERAARNLGRQSLCKEPAEITLICQVNVLVWGTEQSPGPQNMGAAGGSVRVCPGEGRGEERGR